MIGLKMKTRTELKSLAIDIVENKAFGTWNIHNEDLIPCVFTPLMFLSEEQKKELQKTKVAHVYEYIDKATPRGINGMPTFFSMNYLTEDETDALQLLINEYKENKKVFMTT